MTQPCSPNIPPGSGSEPRVSIIIPYYMQEKYILQTVASAKRQTYPNVEIIVVDDGSPVPIPATLEHSDGVRVFRTENHGCPSARNFGFRQSTGDYLLFLDGDDLLRPDAIEVHLRALARRPQAGLSFGPVSIIDALGEQTQPPHLCRPRHDYFLMLLESNPIWSPGSTLIRRDVFVEAGGFDGDLAIQVDDYDLYLRLARLRPFVRHDHWVLEYRLHGSNVSHNQEKMLTGTMAVLNRLEQSGQLNAAQLRRLRYGRKRWIHGFRPQHTLLYRAHGLVFKLRSMLSVARGALLPDSHESVDGN